MCPSTNLQVTTVRFRLPQDTDFALRSLHSSSGVVRCPPPHNLRNPLPGEGREVQLGVLCLSNACSLRRDSNAWLDDGKATCDWSALVDFFFTFYYYFLQKMASRHLGVKSFKKRLGRQSQSRRRANFFTGTSRPVYSSRLTFKWRSTKGFGVGCFRKLSPRWDQQRSKSPSGISWSHLLGSDPEVDQSDVAISFFFFTQACGTS